MVTREAKRNTAGNLYPWILVAALIGAQHAQERSTAQLLLGAIPKTFVDAFAANGGLLQVLLLSVLFGFALLGLGEKGQPIADWLETVWKSIRFQVNTPMPQASIRTNPLCKMGAWYSLARSSVCLPSAVASSGQCLRLPLRYFFAWWSFAGRSDVGHRHRWPHDDAHAMPNVIVNQEICFGQKPGRI